MSEEPQDKGLEIPSEQVVRYFGRQFDRVEHFAKMLADEGELRGLIGPREMPRLWSRHLVNSAAIEKFLPDYGWVADIGSGAGFPGIIGAILRPDLNFNLIEPMDRRCEWLDDVRIELDLRNVFIHNKRAEDMPQSMFFATVTARAVADLKNLVQMATPLVGRKGRLVLLKGQRAREEVDAARSVFERCGFNPPWVHEVEVVPGEEITYIVDARKRWG